MQDGFQGRGQLIQKEQVTQPSSRQGGGRKYNLNVGKLNNLVDRDQIPIEFRPRRPERGEWCCSPFSTFSVYTSYLLVGLRFPLNSFCSSLFHMLGFGPNQLNPNRWRMIVAMQVLWRETLERNRPITVDKFLYCYISPQKLNKLLVFTNSCLGAPNLA